MGSRSSDIEQIVQEPEATDGLTDAELKEEAALAKQIALLWFSEKLRKRTMRRTREELSVLRKDLSERLYSYKQQLARTGRSGRWTAFLNQAEIPRATADRYVNKWKLSLASVPEKRLTEAITAPTEEEIVNLAKKLKPKLVRVLTTTDSVTLFLEQLAKVLQESTPAA